MPPVVSSIRRTLRPAVVASLLLFTGLAMAAIPLEEVRFENPRAGPGGEALQALGGCIQTDDVECVDEAFHGGEAVVRAVREALQGTLSIERPGLMDRYRREAAAGGRDRYRGLLWRSIEACDLSLAAATRGRCDDIGWVDPPPPPQEGMTPELTELFGGLLEDMGAGLGNRRARRVFCGMVRVADEVRAQEALVVLADRPGQEPAVVDIQCRRIEMPLHTEDERADLGETGAPMDADAVMALRALSQGLDCLERGNEACIREKAPLPGVLARELLGHLGQSPPERHQAIIERGRALAADPHARSTRVVELAPRQCLRLARVPDLRRCTASDHEPAPELDPPPAGVDPQASAQTRAMVALLWGRHLELEARRSTITCATPAGPVSLDVVWAQTERAQPLLLDLRCH